MFPFILQLSAGDGEWLHAGRGAASYALGIEAIAPERGFGMDQPQVSRDVSPGSAGFLEALELGMVLITLGLAREHGLCEQCFTPESNQSLRIQVSGMEGPETHD
jgi:hypothetical protein